MTLTQRPCGALTRHVIATDTDNTLHEGLLATGRDEACELSDLADRGRRDLHGPSHQRIVETTTVVFDQRIDTETAIRSSSTSVLRIGETRDQKTG